MNTYSWKSRRKKERKEGEERKTGKEGRKAGCGIVFK